MLTLNLCDSSKYYKDTNSNQNLNRVASSTEDIEIIGSLTGSRRLDLSLLDNCDLKNIASFNVVFWQNNGLVLNDSQYVNIIISGSEDSWIAHHGEYEIDDKYTLDNISTNTFIQVSGASFNSSYLSARKVELNNGAIDGPLVTCNKFTIDSRKPVADTSLVCLRSANIECSEFIANIHKCRIDQSSIIAKSLYEHTNGDISILKSNIMAPNININDGYLLDSVVNFNILNLSGGKISAQCIYDKSLGNDGTTNIFDASTDADFLLECQNLNIGGSGWLQGSMNIQLVSGLVPSLNIGLSGKMIAEESRINTVYNSGTLQINNAYFLQNINNHNKLTINSITGVLSGSGNRIFLYNNKDAECIFYEPNLNLRGLSNFGKIQCQNLQTKSIYRVDVNDGIIEANNIIMDYLTNEEFATIKSLNNMQLIDSANFGFLIANNCELINSKNYSSIQGGPVLFYNSENYDTTNIINEAIFNYKSPHINTPINSGLLENGTFYSGSLNYGSGNNLSFYDISENRSAISGHNQIKFYNSAVNRGRIIDNVSFYDRSINFGLIDFGNFYQDSINSGSVVASRFENNTTNSRYAFNCSFYNFSRNVSGSNGDYAALGCRFFDNAINVDNGYVESGLFYNKSKNISNGAIDVVFFDDSINFSGARNAAFNNKSINLGTVTSGWFNQTINSGLCLGGLSNSVQIYNTVFVGAKAANLKECRDGRVFFYQAASNGEEMPFSNFIDPYSIISSATGVYFSGSSKNLGMIYDSVSVEFGDYSTNFGMIDNCDQVKFTNATNGPSLLVRTDTRPYYTYAGIRNCKNIIFTQNSYNKEILRDNNIITFDENSQNQADIYRAYEVLFLNKSINLAQNITTDKILFNNTVHSIGDIVAGVSMDFDSAINRKSIAYESMAVNFVNNSFNYAPISGHAVVFDMSYNSSSVFVRSNLTFSAGSSNWGTISGDLANMMFDNSVNAGTILTKSSTKETYYNGENPYTNTVTFTNGSINNGTISGAYVHFIDHSINYGVVLGEASFDSTSQNLGVVSGQIF